MTYKKYDDILNEFKILYTIVTRGRQDDTEESISQLLGQWNIVGSLSCITAISISYVTVKAFYEYMRVNTLPLKQQL